jgi:hypothetical protein
MNIRPFALALAFTTGAMLAAPASARAQDLGITLGTHAPAATVTTLAGARANLSQFVG